MTVTIDGMQINYQSTGAGQPLLFLHGWGSSSEAFNRMARPLAARFRCIAPDLPGFGKSDMLPRPFTLQDYCDVVKKFIDALGLRDPVMIGHSNGGRILLKWLGRGDCPLRVKKLVLIDAAGIKPRYGAGYYGKVYTYKLAKKILQLPGVRHLFPDAVERLRGRAGSADYRSASPMMKQCMNLALAEDMSAYLPKIQASTLLIWGENDTATPLADGQKMEKLIPDAGLVVLKGAGHFSFAERWGQCSRVLDAFLKG